MKIIKAMGFTLSMGWSIFLIAFAFKASITEILLLFTGLTSITYIFSIKRELEYKNIRGNINGKTC